MNGDFCDKYIDELFDTPLEKLYPAAVTSIDGASNEISNVPGFTPLILFRQGSRKYLYFQRYFIHERSLERELHSLLKSQSGIATKRDILKVKDILDDVLDRKPVLTPNNIHPRI